MAIVIIMQYQHKTDQRYKMMITVITGIYADYKLLMQIITG